MAPTLPPSSSLRRARSRAAAPSPSISKAKMCPSSDAVNACAPRRHEGDARVMPALWIVHALARRRVRRRVERLLVRAKDARLRAHEQQPVRS